MRTTSRKLSKQSDGFKAIWRDEIARRRAPGHTHRVRRQRPKPRRHPIIRAGV